MSGRVIAIEDSAYTSLKAYLESLHQYFAQEEGHDEILNDIESRIAELMDERIHRGSQAITAGDIESIIASIGRVEDFAAADEEPGNTHKQWDNQGGASTTSTKNKRFYRDVNDKIAGGVCSGLAAYLNLDPALVRIVFAILALGGIGSGILLYIILWIFVPAAPLERYKGRRLFRDADDKWIGGVCSGIARYFDKEPWIFRLIFAAPFLLSMFSGTIGFLIGTSFIFGSFTGTFILIYLVLWIVLPIATTDFEKMEMRGEKVDLRSIRNNVMADIKDRTSSFGAEVSESASRISGDARNFISTRGRSFAQEAREAGKPIAARGGHVIGSLLKYFLLFIGIMIAFSLFMVLISYSFGGFSGIFNNFILRSPGQRTLGWATIILFFGVPLIGLVTLMVRRALRIRTGGKYFGMGYSILWIGGWICLVALIAQVSQEFGPREIVTQNMPITQPVNGNLYITVPDPGIEYSNSLPFLKGDISGWDINRDIMKSAGVMVLPSLSPDSQYHVIVKRSAMGSSAKEATDRASHISYGLHNRSDSVLALDNGYTITAAEGYRVQQVVVEIQVPLGKHITFDGSVYEKLESFNLNPIHFNHNHKRRNQWAVGWSHHSDDWDMNWETPVNSWKPGIVYTMTAGGELMDAAANTVSSHLNGNYHRDSTHRVMDSLEQSIDRIQERKDRLEESEEDD